MFGQTTPKKEWQAQIPVSVLRNIDKLTEHRKKKWWQFWITKK